MLTFDRILVPIDFSGGTRDALGYALDLGRALSARVDVLHAWTPEVYPIPMMGSVPPAPDAGQAEAEANLAAYVEHLSVAERRVVVGLPAEVIPRAAEDYDLVVLSTHGRSGAADVLLGSTAETIVRRAKIPVCTVPRGARHGTPPLRRILAAVDFDECSTRAFRFAQRLARASGAALEALHVVGFPMYLGAALAHEDLEARGRLIERFAREQAGEKMKETFPVEVPTHLAVGDPSTEIAHHARDFDAVVIGTHGRSLLSRMFLGGVANKLLHVAPCPVFTVRDYSEPAG